MGIIYSEGADPVPFLLSLQEYFCALKLIAQNLQSVYKIAQNVS